MIKEKADNKIKKEKEKKENFSVTYNLVVEEAEELFTFQPYTTRFSEDLAEELCSLQTYT